MKKILLFVSVVGGLGTNKRIVVTISRKKDRNGSEERSPNQGSEEEKQSDPNFGPWMFVTRKKNLVRNGWSRFPLGSDLERDVSPKGIFVQKGANSEDLKDGGLVNSNKVEVLSNQFDSKHVVCDVPDQ